MKNINKKWFLGVAKNEDTPPYNKAFQIINSAKGILREVPEGDIQNESVMVENVGFWILNCTPETIEKINEYYPEINFKEILS